MRHVCVCPRHLVDSSVPHPDGIPWSFTSKFTVAIFMTRKEAHAHISAPLDRRYESFSHLVLTSCLTIRGQT